MEFILNPSNVDSLLEYISKHGKVTKSTVTLTFDLDFIILKYLQGWRNFQIKDNLFRNFNDNKVDYYDSYINLKEYLLDGNISLNLDYTIDIGYFDIYIKTVNNLTKIELCAVTDDMSLMLKYSYSIWRYFLDCAKYSKCRWAYLNFDGDLKILWNGKRAMEKDILNAYDTNIIENEYQEVLELLI